MLQRRTHLLSNAFSLGLLENVSYFENVLYILFMTEFLLHCSSWSYKSCEILTTIKFYEFYDNNIKFCVYFTNTWWYILCLNGNIGNPMTIEIYGCDNHKIFCFSKIHKKISVHLIKLGVVLEIFEDVNELFISFSLRAI